MTINEHERAKQLALAGRVEEIGGAEQRWLESHLQGCETCSDYVAALDSAVASIRMPAITASSALVQATRRRVRARGAELQARDAAMRPLWIAVAMVCAWAALTTPVVWAAFAWLGAALQLSKTEWRALFVFAWIAPALAASLVLLGSGPQRAQAALAHLWEAR